MKFDPDFGMLVRSHLIGLELEEVSTSSRSFSMSHTERKAVIEQALNQIYEMVGVNNPQDIKDLAKNIYQNYQGMSYRYFPELKQPYFLKGASYGYTNTHSCEIVDERDWTSKRLILIHPIKMKSVGLSIVEEHITLLAKFFTQRPVFDLDVLKRQIEETMKLLYKPEHKFEIDLKVYYGN